MDLSKAMRFCMTRAQAEAAGNEVKTEHLFLGLLELDKPQQQKLPEDEIRAVKKILAEYGVRPGRDGDRLRELLRAERQSAEGDIPSLLAGVITVCKRQGKSEVSAASMLKLILESPTALISRALKDEPQPKVKPRDDEPVFFHIPQPDDPPPPPPPRRKRRTKINGFTFRGGPVWAAIQYFFLALAVPFALMILAEHQWLALSAPSAPLIASLPWLILFLSVWLICFGVVSLARQTFRALAGFLAFLSNIALISLAVCACTHVAGHEAPPVSVRVIASVLTLGFLFVSAFQLSQIKSSRSEVLNTSVLRLQGTPAVLFFTYLLRAMIIPVITASIFWIFNLPVSNVWKTVFSIYGFLLLYETVHTALKCLKIKFLLYMPVTSIWGAITASFLQLQCRLWFLPLLGWFLMWHFGWFPMAAWLKWIYGIYIALISLYTLIYLFSAGKK